MQRPIVIMGGILMLNLQKTSGTGLFSASTLKILACIFMAIDHVGARLFPELTWLRIIGRLAFPLFAYFIAEGCIYTKNKKKRLITIAALGGVCEAAYVLYTGEFYGNILLTFTLSIVIIYALWEVKKIIGLGDFQKSVFAALIFFLLTFAAVKVCKIMSLDYGFTGVMLPVLTAVFNEKDDREKRLLAFSIGLMAVIMGSGIESSQTWCILSVLFLALYNGKPGTKKLKYGFYAFYPVHLLIIELIALVV